MSVIHNDDHSKQYAQNKVIRKIKISPYTIMLEFLCNRSDLNHVVVNTK